MEVGFEPTQEFYLNRFKGGCATITLFHNVLS